MKSILFLGLIMIPTIISAQYTGYTPWENCFGKNASCPYVGCSEIKVDTSNSSVMAIVKKYGKIIKHAYISPNSSYTFELKDGTYQVFFFYGDNWNSQKKMKSDECSSIYGGFTNNESVSKDSPITLNGQIMTYSLTRTEYGNFSPKGSSLEEAL
jgi:hypothetical protein